MKKFGIIILLLSINFVAFSQYDTTPPYLKSKLLPAFKLLSVDSTVFTENVLDSSKQTIFMLFHPECDHCQQQLELILSMPEIAQKAILIMISGEEPLYKNRAFYKKNHLEKYGYIHLGKDFKYFFGGFFQPNTVPILAFYNKQRTFTLIKRGNAEKQFLLDALNK
jgi:hypothetical protein